MCGIAGWFDPRVREEGRSARLTAMCDAIRHRGPDDEGMFFDGPAALGIRRLSIVDIEGGAQPIHGKGGALTLVMNGEIYNHNELRAEMRQQGLPFVSRSDTEVFLRLYETQGVNAFSLCNGMFGAAFWDSKAEELLLVRDRLGVKPLYYYWDGQSFFFASEIKAILASGMIRPEVDMESVWHYLTFRYVPGPKSIWKNIYKLPSGHYLRFTTGMTVPEITQWWDIPYAYPSREASDADFDKEFSKLLDNASNLRMLADVPVGILLSGGLDSSVVAALAQRNAARPIKTFSVAFAGAADIDERRYARLMAKHLGTDHHELEIGVKEFQDFLPDFTYYADEPLADLASIPLFHICRLASKQVSVVLSGEGSDEILAGYNFELRAKEWEETRKRRGIKRLADAFFPRPEQDMREWPIPMNMTSILTGEEKKTLFGCAANFPDSFDSLRHYLASLGKQAPLHQALYLYCKDWLVEDLLMKADKMSMANSLELRTPFLDYRIVEWAAKIPPEQKAGRNPDGTWSSKRILRRLAVSLLPPEIIDRPKMGFPVPAYTWLSGELRDFAHDLLGAGARTGSWFTPQAMQKILYEGTAKEAGTAARHQLWQFLILEIWARRWGI